MPLRPRHSRLRALPAHLQAPQPNAHSTFWPLRHFLLCILVAVMALSLCCTAPGLWAIWAATGGAAASSVLLSQGAAPALLAAVCDGAQSGTAAAMDAAGVAAWALASVVSHCASRERDQDIDMSMTAPDAPSCPALPAEVTQLRAANIVLACKAPTCSAALQAALSSHNSALVTEAAWLAATIVATGTPASQQLCIASVRKALCAQLTAALHCMSFDDRLDMQQEAVEVWLLALLCALLQKQDDCVPNHSAY